VGTLITQTDFGYTGQRNNAYINLMDYRARFYSPYLNRWIQPDSIVPDITNSQAWNRYSYVNNDPVNYTDPSGHVATGANDDEICLPGSYCDPTQDGSGGVLSGVTSDPHIDPMYEPWLSGYDFGEEKEWDTCLDRAQENYETCYHPGIDVASAYLMIIAPATGTINFLYMEEGFGNYIIIEEAMGNGIANYYILAHLRDANTYHIPQGSLVEVGTPIGVMGETGMKGGIHLHYEIQHHNIGDFEIYLDSQGNPTHYSVDAPTLGNYHRFYPRYRHQLNDYWINPWTWSDTNWYGPREPFAPSP
jgi:RHS repeat-associated protein